MNRISEVASWQPLSSPFEPFRTNPPSSSLLDQVDDCISALHYGDPRSIVTHSLVSLK